MSNFSRVTGIWPQLVFQGLSCVHGEREREEFSRSKLSFPEIGVDQVPWSGHWRCEGRNLGVLGPSCSFMTSEISVPVQSPKVGFTVFTSSLWRKQGMQAQMSLFLPQIRFLLT